MASRWGFACEGVAASSGAGSGAHAGFGSCVAVRRAGRDPKALCRFTPSTPQPHARAAAAACVLRACVHTQCTTLYMHCIACTACASLQPALHSLYCPMPHCIALHQCMHSENGSGAGGGTLHCTAGLHCTALQVCTAQAHMRTYT